MGWDRKDALGYALSRGVQISPRAFEILRSVPSDSLEGVVKAMVHAAKRESRTQMTADDLEEHLGLRVDAEVDADLRVLSDPTGHTTTAEGVDGYGALFASRYEKLKSVIAARPESKKVKSVESVRRSGGVKDDEDAYVAGLINDREVRDSRAEILLEDPSGVLSIPVYNEELQKEAGSLMRDQMAMVRLGRGKRGVFAKEIILPDTPAHVPNRSETGAWAALISDLHVGSKYFMEEEFRGFVGWLSEADAVARNVRFVLICGDVVDGVGIYKDQDKELEMDTVEEQLGRLEEMLAEIPERVKIIISPGNHDPGRRALPQPAIPEKYCPGLWRRENITMVGNPAVVSLNGVRVLMFHGQSIDDIVRVTPGLSYDEPIAVMELLLRARHLSPIYGERTPIAPELEDWMVIGDDIDIFHAGHVHRWAVSKYRGTLLVNSGAWQRQTPFQASVGIVPNPGIAALVNLKTYELKSQNYNG